MKEILENPYHAPTDLQSPMSTELQPGRKSRVPQLIAIWIMVLSGTVMFFLVTISPFAWILRDGLGPDSKTSVGWAAFNHMFWCFNLGPATLLAILIYGLALFAYRKFTR